MFGCHVVICVSSWRIVNSQKVVCMAGCYLKLYLHLKYKGYITKQLLTGILATNNLLEFLPNFVLGLQQHFCLWVKQIKCCSLIYPVKNVQYVICEFITSEQGFYPIVLSLFVWWNIELAPDFESHGKQSLLCSLACYDICHYLLINWLID